MDTVTFGSLPVGAWFLDYAYSDMWMKKIDARPVAELRWYEPNAQWQDGQCATVQHDCPVKVNDALEVA
jgi:hypothetical protein